MSSAGEKMGAMFRHVLLPTDGSELSRKTVQAGLDLVQSLGAELTLLHVTMPLAPESLSADGALREIREQADIADAYAREALGPPVDEARRRGIRCDGVHKVGVDPWRLIVDVATERGCDLIMMASHGRRGIDALLMGSETNKVLSHSKIPVLVYR